MLADAPPWTLRFLTDHWETIRRGSMDAWMPREGSGSTTRKRKADALGCGHYGCVFLTNTPGLVMKISSDATEATFINAALKLGEWPDGIVKYQAILDLPGAHRGRPVFIIWREEAFDVGKHDEKHYAYREFQSYHEAYLNAARVIREASTKPTWKKQLADAAKHQDWAWGHIVLEDGNQIRRGYGMVADPPFMRYRGGQRLAAAFRICQIAFEMIENTAYAHEVGAALGFYLEHGILLADVHRQNIGKVVRVDPGYGEQEYTVITDPGHSVFFR
ncbi:MAG: hypothetical protein ACREJC_05535 [Tepidisphaeraceae bacterium]